MSDEPLFNYEPQDEDSYNYSGLTHFGKYRFYYLAICIILGMLWLFYRIVTHPDVPLYIDDPKELSSIHSKENLSFSFTPIESPNEQLPFALEVTIQTNTISTSPRIEVECDGAIGDAKLKMVGVGIHKVYIGINGNVFVCQSGFPLQNPWVIIVSSSTKINVIRVSHILK
jgi:hypothetical protein